MVWLLRKQREHQIQCIFVFSSVCSVAYIHIIYIVNRVSSKDSLIFSSREKERCEVARRRSNPSSRNPSVLPKKLVALIQPSSLCLACVRAPAQPSHDMPPKPRLIVRCSHCCFGAARLLLSLLLFCPFLRFVFRRSCFRGAAGTSITIQVSNPAV